MSILQGLMPSHFAAAMNLPTPSASAAQGAAPTAATAAAGTSSTDPSQAQSLGDSSSTGAGQAAAGASAVSTAPPSPAKIVLSSVIRGALSGSSLFFGVNKFLPSVIGKEVDGKFVDGVLGKVIHMIPFVPDGPLGWVATLAIGAGIGAIYGLVTGVIKSKKAVAAYNAAQQQAAAATTDPNAAAGATTGGAPAATGTGTDTDPSMATADGTQVAPAGQPVPGMATDPTAAAAAAPAAMAATPKNPVMTGTSGARKSADANYHIKRGDTLWAISHRYHTSIAAIMAANKGHITNANLIYAGDSINVPGA